MLTRKGRLVLYVSFVLFCAFANVSKTHANENPNILILNSYSRDFSWTDDQTMGFIQTFKQTNIDATYFIEYLDWKNHPSKDNLFEQQELLQIKYGTKKLDLIYTTDDAALKFVMEHRRELFQNVPVVFSGVYGTAALALIAGESNVTGVYEKMDTLGTLQMMRTFNPKLKTIYLLGDDTESGLESSRLIEKDICDANPDLSIKYFYGKNYDTINHELQQLPDNSAVLMASYSRDAEETTMEPERYVKMFSSNSRVPVYVLYDFEMGSGTVGGSVLSGKSQGIQAGQLGLKILAGEKPFAVAPINIPSNVIMLDYQALKRYGISLDKVPADSQVINHPWSFYDEYWQGIWMTISAFFMMMVYILLLMRNIKQRKSAESVLKKSNEELTALYEEVYASEDTLHKQYQELSATQCALQKSQERYQLSFDGANDGLWDWDIIADKLYLSDRCDTILARKMEGICSSRDFLRKIVLPEDQKKMIDALRDHLSGKSAYYACEYRLNVSKELKWILIRGKAFINGQGHPTRMAGSLTDITLRKASEASIHYLAYYDSLTGLANRTALHEQLQTILAGGSDQIEGGALLFIDVDNFKVVNDTLGHSYGDALLIEIAKQLRNLCGTSQFIARMGGDEFVVLFKQLQTQREVCDYVKTLKDFFSTSVIIEEKKTHVTCSIGITYFPSDGVTADTLLQNADLAMYKAKSNGKNQYAFFDEKLAEHVQKQAHMERHLREALSKGELELWYQPQICLSSHSISGFEALVRWHSKEYGWMMPLEFIGFAEKSGFIIPMGQFVLRQACLFIKKLYDEGYGELTVTVNISVVQLLENDFVESVQTILAETGVNARYIGFEITESILMESLDLNVHKLEALRKLGITIYLDDFGTGYSSLKYLQDLPIDVVKIDKSFVDNLKRDQVGKTLTEVIIELAHLLDIKTVAEGVETEEQLELLRRYSCEAVQGYFFSGPVPEGKVRELLESGRLF